MADAPSERDNETPEPLEPAAPPAAPPAVPAPLDEPDHGWAGPTVVPDDDPAGDGDGDDPIGGDEAGIRDINETDIF
jgi:hypothetical protein